MTQDPYGPPPAATSQQPQSFTSPQAQYAPPQQAQPQSGEPQQSGQPQYGQPQYGQAAAPYPSPYGTPKTARRGKGMMIAGPIIFLVGVLITIVTYSLAPPGGTYLISFGPMIWGIIWFIRGLVTYNRSKPR
ncbi:MAG: hypothetical protein J2P24_14125 [Streptosporangiales bacterium]|nr:hypothetical protein [Streptosporangiales bacterium]MBO0892223.1 hypothetical protein [Acidothermales bacterium]